MYFLNRSAAIDDFTLFLTLMFGYIVTAYFAAHKLGKSEKILLTVLYTVPCLSLTFGIFGGLMGMAASSYALSGELSIHWVWLPTSALVLGWAASLWFMYKEGKASDPS